MGQLAELPLDPATNGGYTPQAYHLTETAAALSSVPRLTSSHCIQDLFESDLRDDYLVGLLSGTIFVICVYLLWTLVVLVLKCLGPKKVGCASGTPVKPSKPVNRRNATGSRLRIVNPYEEGADEEFLAEVAAGGGGGGGGGVERGSGKNLGEYGGIGDDGDGIYEAAHRARYGEAGGTYTKNDHGDGDDDDFAFTNTVTSELAFGDETGPPKGKGGRVAPYGLAAAVGDDGEEYDYDVALAQWERKQKKYDRKMAVTRVLFLFCGCAVIASSVLFYYEGVWGLGKAIQSVQDGVEHAQSVITQAHNLTVGFLESQSAVSAQRSSFETTEDICPGLFEELTGNIALPPGTGANGTALPSSEDVEAIADEAAEAIRDAARNVSRWMDGVGDQLVATAVDLQNGLQDAALQSQQINEQLDNLYPYLWTSVSIAATVDFLVLVFMISVLTAWCGCKCNTSCAMRWIRQALCMPMFLIMVFMSWMCAAVFLLGAVAGADFCVAPDVHVSKFLEKMRDDAINEARGNITEDGQDAEFEVTLVYDLVQYYVRQCRADSYPSDVYDAFTNFADVVGGAAAGFDQFLDSVANAPPGGSLEAICGENGASAVTNSASVLHAQLHVLWDVLAGALGLMSCGNGNPIYNSISHDAVCVNGQSALAWIMATSLSIAFFSMMMVSLRAAWYTASVEKAEEHVFRSKKHEEERHRKERREQCCSLVLWALLVALMIASLVLSIYYGLNGFQGEAIDEQCPAEQRQFASINGNVQSEQMPTFSPITSKPTPTTAMIPSPTVAPTIYIPTTTKTTISSEQTTTEATNAPSSSTTASPTADSQLDMPVETKVPACTGKRSSLHKIVFKGLEKAQGDALDMFDGVDFAIRTEGPTPGEVETVYSVPLGTASGKEHFICLMRQSCYYAVLDDSSAALEENDGLSWEVQQLDLATPDVPDQRPATIASGKLLAASGECTFSVPLKNPSKRPVCPTTCSAADEKQIVPKCNKRLSTLHELTFLPSTGGEQLPVEMEGAAIKISVRLPSGDLKDVRIVQAKDLNSQKAAENYFCLRKDRCYIATAVFPAGSRINDDGSSVHWQMRKVLTGNRAGEFGKPVASGSISPTVAQGPGNVPSKQCTFALTKGSNGGTESDSVCPTTCEPPNGENIFNDSATLQKSLAQAECEGQKEVLHEITTTDGMGNGANLTIEQEATATGLQFVYTTTLRSETQYICLKRQQCYSASLDGAPAAKESEASWKITQVDKHAFDIIIASGAVADHSPSTDCTFTVLPKNPSKNPICPTTCMSLASSQRAQPQLSERNIFDNHKHQPRSGLVPAQAAAANAADDQGEHDLDIHRTPH